MVGLYLSPAEQGLALCLDGKSQVQALVGAGYSAIIWLEDGHVARRHLWYSD